MEEEVHKISINDDGSSSLQESKPMQVMDVKPPIPAIDPSVSIDDSISPEEPPAGGPTPVGDKPESSTTNADPSASATAPTKEEHKTGGHEHPAPSPKPTKLTTEKLVKVLAIIIVALILISVVLYVYMKHK